MEELRQLVEQLKNIVNRRDRREMWSSRSSTNFDESDMEYFHPKCERRKGDTTIGIRMKISFLNIMLNFLNSLVCIGKETPNYILVILMIEMF